MSKYIEFFGSSKNYEEHDSILQGIKDLQTVLRVEILVHLNTLSSKDKELLQTGKKITHAITGAGFIFALDTLTNEDFSLVKENFNRVGKMTKYSLSTFFHLFGSEREYYIDIEIPPDEDYLEFEDETSEVVPIVEAVSEKPLLAMSAKAGGR